MKEGMLSVQTIYYGSYKKAAEKYIKRILKQTEHKNVNMGVLTYAGCSHEMREWIEEKLLKQVTVTEFWEQRASATVSCNCGPLTFGIFLWQMEEKE
jgi:fatty acid-binding protein DegV